jgi:O-antigen/teichoic acid export membrane protein
MPGTSVANFAKGAEGNRTLTGTRVVCRAQMTKEAVSGSETILAAQAQSLARARRQGITVMALRLAGAAIALGAQVLASRLLGPEDFGRYSLPLVWMLLLGYAATAGNGHLVCRYLAQYVKAGDAQRAAGLLRFVMGAVMGLALLLAAVAIAILNLDPFGLDPRYILIGTLALAGVPLVALQDFLESIARGLDRPALGIGPSFVLRHLAILAGLVTLIVLGQQADALTVMGFTLAGLIASVAAQYALLSGHLRRALGGAQPRYEIRRWFKTALPMATSDTVEILLLNADVLILGLLVAPEYVAFYFAATRLAQILAYVPYGATAATAQKYAGLSAPGDHGELQSLVGSTATLSTCLAAAGALVLSLLAGPLLGLFGAEFTAAAPLVGILSLGIVLSCAFGPGEDVLNMLGEERLCSAGFLAALAVNVALNFALIPVFGLSGAAIATVIALGVRGALLAVFAWRRLGLVLPAGLSLIPAYSRNFARGA